MREEEASAGAAFMPPSSSRGIPTGMDRVSINNRDICYFTVVSRFAYGTKPLFVVCTWHTAPPCSRATLLVPAIFFISLLAILDISKNRKKIRKKTTKFFDKGEKCEEFIKF